MSALDEVNEKIALLRVPLALGPLLIHTRHLLAPSPGLWFFTATWVHIAVPLFFSFSGYLYAGALNVPGSSYIGILKRKVKSLVIPYLFWAGGLVVCHIVYRILFRSAPSAVGTFEYNADMLIQSIFGLSLNGLHPPLNAPLWSIRDLLAHFLLGPIYYRLLKRYFSATVVCVTVLFVAVTWPVLKLPFLEWFNIEGLCFFVLGMSLWGREAKLKSPGFRVWLGSGFVFFGACLLHLYWLDLSLDDIYRTPALCVLIPSGTVFIWRLADFVKRFPIGTWLVAHGAGLSFLIFVTHMFYLLLAKVVLGNRLAPKGPLLDWGVLLFFPMVVTLGCYVADGFLERYPWLSGLLTGRRSGRSPGGRSRERVA